MSTRLRAPRARPIAISAALAIVGLVLAACGGGSGPGVASAGSSTSTTIAGNVAGNSGGPPTAAQLEAMTKWAACVRKHGLPHFPDPPYQNGELNKMGYTKYSPQMIKADNACHALALAAGAVESQAEREKYLAQDLKISQCMRAHGVTHFPDPSANGGFVQSVSQSQSLESNPNYSAAAKVCGAPPSG
ncbi:MAG: hypothetical protein WB770_08250 [Acidimicrobiales bacterium]